jgi:hypothetical protein
MGFLVMSIDELIEADPAVRAARRELAEAGGREAPLFKHVSLANKILAASRAAEATHRKRVIAAR